MCLTNPKKGKKVYVTGGKWFGFENVSGNGEGSQVPFMGCRSSYWLWVNGNWTWLGSVVEKGHGPRPATDTAEHRWSMAIEGKRTIKTTAGSTKKIVEQCCKTSNHEGVLLYDRMTDSMTMWPTMWLHDWQYDCVTDRMTVWLTIWPLGIMTNGAIITSFYSTFLVVMAACWNAELPGLVILPPIMLFWPIFRFP